MSPCSEGRSEEGRAEEASSEAVLRLAPELYAELRALAARALRQERSGHTLQPTALAHEALARLSRAETASAVDRAQLLALASRTMRRILVDHARQRRARLDRERLSIETQDSLEGAASPQRLDLLALEDSLKRLEQLHARQARVVELRFFGGLSVDEAALALTVSPRTVDADWHAARAWLERELRGSATR